MPAAVKVLYQKRGVNFKTTVFGITLSGIYPGDPGEVVTLTSAASNPSATTVTGPSGAAALGAKVAAEQLGGWAAQLTPTATAGQYDLSFWNGTTELTNIGYPAVISGGLLTVEVDHDLQGL
jgi:hypothetical protein